MKSFLDRLQSEPEETAPSSKSCGVPSSGRCWRTCPRKEGYIWHGTCSTWVADGRYTPTDRRWARSPTITSDRYYYRPCTWSDHNGPVSSQAALPAAFLRLVPSRSVPTRFRASITQLRESIRSLNDICHGNHQRNATEHVLVWFVTFCAKIEICIRQLLQFHHTTIHGDSPVIVTRLNHMNFTIQLKNKRQTWAGSVADVKRPTRPTYIFRFYFLIFKKI